MSTMHTISQTVSILRASTAHADVEQSTSDATLKFSIAEGNKEKQ